MIRPIVRTATHALVMATLLTVGARTASAQITFVEQNFAPGSFSVSTVNGGGGGSASQAVLAGGNPGPSLAITHSLASGAPSGGFCARWEWTFVTMTGAVVNPAALGGVASVDFSLDSAWISSSPGIFMPQSQAAIVVQNGRIYISMRPPGVIGGNGSWSTMTMNALLASEFDELVNVPPCQFTDPSQHPDFSPLGAPIQLGFARGNSTSVGGNPDASIISHAADNWMMTAHPCGLSISQQPESASACASGGATFSVAAAGSGPFTYQWQWQPDGSVVWIDAVDGANVDPGSGQTAFHTVNGGHIKEAIEIVIEQFPPKRLRCIVSKACGSLASDAATLTVCAADFNCDGFLDFTDFDAFVTAFEAGDVASDFNADGFIDFTDFDAFVSAFEAGC